MESQSDWRAAILQIALGAEAPISQVAKNAQPKRPRLTRARRPQSSRPRIARRYSRPTSLRLTCDWDLVPNARHAAVVLNSLRKEEPEKLRALTAAMLASHLGHTVRAAQRWLRALEEAGYIQTRPGRLRGAYVVTLLPKLTRNCQLSEKDLEIASKKNEEPDTVPTAEVPTTIVSPLKEEFIKQVVVEPVDNVEKSPVPVPEPETAAAAAPLPAHEEEYLPRPLAPTPIVDEDCVVTPPPPPSRPPVPGYDPEARLAEVAAHWERERAARAAREAEARRLARRVGLRDPFGRR